MEPHISIFIFSRIECSLLLMEGIFILMLFVKDLFKQFYCRVLFFVFEYLSSVGNFIFSLIKNITASILK